MVNIAIDGPSGAGKSTIAKALAKRLKIIYLDTGAMYRATALNVLDQGFKIENIDEVKKSLKNLKLDIKYSDGEQLVYLNGRDVSRRIREHFVSKAASDVSKYPEVRKALVKMQREIALKNNIVLDGRDITSYVLPNAKYKFYVTATPEERAKRRYLELKSKGQDISYETVLKDLNARDYNDSNREFAPLIQTDDSIFIDTTGLEVDQSVALVLEYINEKDFI